MDAAKMCSAKHLKSIFFTKFCKNQQQKTLEKPFLLIFLQIFLQHFSNRPYPNVKIILAYFSIIKTI